jgi:hypothetical protein
VRRIVPVLRYAIPCTGGPLLLLPALLTALVSPNLCVAKRPVSAGIRGRMVISLVRSNPKGDIGFLGDLRRMNVALTRARRKLVVIGDSATLAGEPFYQRMIEYFEGLGAYRTVWEDGDA